MTTFKKFFIALGCILLFSTTPTQANEQPSVSQGKKLFNDPTLAGSPNGKSCDSCHSDGRGLADAGGKATLKRTINRCIMGPMKGHELPEDSTDFQSLELYIKSLGGQ